MAVISEVTIYTDGACSGNPGPGGWAAILMAGGAKKEMSGGERDTTNNRMELMAVIEGLKALKRPCKVDIYSDSAYVVNAFEQNWIGKWVKNGWKNSAKAEVANSDLWKELIDLTAMHDVTFHKVKGHADNEFNNRCDELAVAEWKKLSGSKGNN
ncbi:ribonuclease HI [Ruminococcaceae bacterium YAD3003]|nr:ribonuclease HI [Ruminococcaceae bacterium YAD3003]